MYAKALVLLFVSLLIAKYGFKVKVDEKYIYGLVACYMIINTFGNKYSAIEMFDGSSVAFDKEAFENLNRVVNEIAGEGKLTIPGNLIVQGTVTVNGDTELKGITRLRNHTYVNPTKTLFCEYLQLKKDDIKATLRVDKPAKRLIIRTGMGGGTNVGSVDIVKPLKRLTVNEDAVLKSNCTIKNNKDLIVEGSGGVKINNQRMTGSSSYGIIGPKFLADAFKCQGGQTYIDKTNGIKTDKLAELEELYITNARQTFYIGKCLMHIYGYGETDRGAGLELWLQRIRGTAAESDHYRRFKGDRIHDKDRSSHQNNIKLSTEAHPKF